MCDNTVMEYEIETTNIFDKWLAGVGSIQHRARIINRFDHVRLGNFGDHKHLGDKSTQGRDINKARAILAELE